MAPFSCPQNTDAAACLRRSLWPPQPPLALQRLHYPLATVMRALLAAGLLFWNGSGRAWAMLA
jgi:hypothetical protein